MASRVKGKGQRRNGRGAKRVAAPRAPVADEDEARDALDGMSLVDLLASLREEVARLSRSLGREAFLWKLGVAYEARAPNAGIEARMSAFERPFKRPEPARSARARADRAAFVCEEIAKAIRTDLDDTKALPLVRAVEATLRELAELPKRSTQRVTLAVAVLDWARRFVEQGVPVETCAILAARWAESRDMGGLDRVSVEAWSKAIGAWRGKQPAPRGNPRGRKLYRWEDVVFELLKPQNLTSAIAARNMAKADAEKERTRRRLDAQRQR